MTTPSDGHPTDGHPTDTARPTVLPLRRPTPTEDNSPSSARIVPDHQQRDDHGGRPIEPVTRAGLPYRYKVRLDRSNVYASTADEVLALFIDGYDPQPDYRNQEVHYELGDLRGRHLLGLMVTRLTDAALDGLLTGQQETWLRRSTVYGIDEAGREIPPIQSTDCPVWDHPTVAMWLPAELYLATFRGFRPPNGNIVFIPFSRPADYLLALARNGLIQLAENPALTTGGTTVVHQQ